MDAQVAYGFHHLRDEKPYLASGPIANKVFDHWSNWMSFMNSVTFLLVLVYMMLHYIFEPGIFVFLDRD
jgi:hypothetical protein